jgi:plasmid stabilization system protein ParE
MKKYFIDISEIARGDLRNLSYTITETYQSPLTAIRYLDGIFEKIRILSKFPEAYPVRPNLSLLQYGVNVRRINYKKMAIIYTINENTVYIHRVIASSLITES